MDQVSNPCVRLHRLVSDCADSSSSTQDLNADTLIKDVFERKTISNCPQANKAQWRAISIKYNLSVEYLENKWKGLRKSFRKELKKIPRNEKNEYLQDPHVFSSTWRYYRSMLFLVDRIRLKPISEVTGKTEVKMSSSMNPIEIAGNKRRLDNVDSENDNDDEETVNSTPFGKSKQSRKEHVFNDHQKQTKNTADMQSDIENVAEEPTENLTSDVFEQQNPDLKPQSDYLFLMSLHPFMDKIHPLRKLHVRSLLYNALHEELFC